MAVPTLSGLVDDQDILSNERVVDMDPEISMLDPETSQFTTMIMRQKRRPANSTKVEHLEDQLFPRLSSVNGAQSDSDTSIEVAAGEGAYFRGGDGVRNARTGEFLRVISVATDTLTVATRGIGRVAAAAMNNGDQLLITGNSSAQGATLGTRKVTKRVAAFNYTQIFRNPYGFTRSLMASKLYGGPEPDKERQKKAVDTRPPVCATIVV